MCRKKTTTSEFKEKKKKIVSAILKIPNSSTFKRGILDTKDFKTISTTSYKTKPPSAPSKEESKMPFSPTSTFLANSPRCDLAMSLFSTTVPYLAYSRSCLSETSSSVQTHFRAAKANECSQFRVKAMFLYTHLCIHGLVHSPTDV